MGADQAVDVLKSDYVTVSRTPDGEVAVVYVPGRRTISIDRSALPADVSAAWIDPASGQQTPVAMADSFSTPGLNGDGDSDWLLLFKHLP